MSLSFSDSGLQALLQHAYLEACEAELRAFKPGNVSVYSEGHDMTVEDFRRSARLSAPHLVNFTLSLGEKMFYAMAATREAVGCNTNLGILLLCAPLCQAMQTGKSTASLRSRLGCALAGTTRDDAVWAYRAIRLAQPGGLGESAQQDVASIPDVRLIDAMRIASDRDRIAYQYVSCYRDVLGFAKRRYYTAFNRWNSEPWAAVAVFVGLLSRYPDSHVVRKSGHRFTAWMQATMVRLEQRLLCARRPESILPYLREVDEVFKSAGINPGTTADLTVACLLSVRFERMLAQQRRGDCPAPDCGSALPYA